jgi:glutathione S-transferase
MVHLGGKHMKAILPPFPVPGFLQGFVFKQFSKTVGNQSKAQGIGRHSQEEIEKLGLDDLRAVSKILGNKPFVHGDSPTVIDCTLFAFMCYLLATDEADDSTMKKEVEKEDSEMKNLKEFMDRMKEKYYSDWDKLLYKEPEKPEKPAKKEKKEESKKDEEKKEEGEELVKDKKEDEDKEKEEEKKD